ncbi:hypothetical protein K2Z83_01870 [Oscillochloris sp. ZM17-4]|uniref:hypothetical protein n=1 Tax=Oscillochloris sp. ZM17-4 TaxID=2866714 RepID=UPI001C730334|nr:hypothetical protein [Oscillochloris sp. ZM17-4]MBX0326441.1 hypothetical protein [Oscillochloris sp. ZM17-4]
MSSSTRSRPGSTLRPLPPAMVSNLRGVYEPFLDVIAAFLGESFGRYWRARGI